MRIPCKSLASQLFEVGKETGIFQPNLQVFCVNGKVGAFVEKEIIAFEHLENRNGLKSKPEVV